MLHDFLSFHSQQSPSPILYFNEIIFFLWPCVFVQGSDNYMLGDDGFSKASFPAIFNWRCG